jgi:dihydrofolate reductase
MGEIVIVAAIAQNGVIGKDNKLPWDPPGYSEDMKHFKQLTLDQTVVMGRNTYESIIKKLHKPLPKRRNIVITSREIEGVETYKSLEDAVMDNNEDLYIIGGARLYEVALPFADRLELTHISKDYDGDTFFPDINYSEWNLFNERYSGELIFRTYLRGNNNERIHERT